MNEFPYAMARARVEASKDRAMAREKRQQRARIVYVLFHETNTGRGDDSDGYVEAVYATEEAAEAAKLAAIRKAIVDGLSVWSDPDEAEFENITWEHDWHVEAHQVLAS